MDNPAVRKNKVASNELRALAVQAIENNYGKFQEIADMFKINKRTMKRAWDQYYEIGTSDKKKQGGYKTKILTPDMVEHVHDILDDDCLIKLDDIQSQLEAVHGLVVSTATIRKAVKSFNYSLFRVAIVATNNLSPEYDNSRLAYAQWSIDMTTQNRNIIYIDETSFNLSVRASIGKTAVGITSVEVPQIKCRHITVIAAMTKSELNYSVLNNYQNDKVIQFTNYIDHLALWRDNNNILNAILVLNEVPFNHSQVVIEILQIRGFEWHYLPPYSPFFHPIEHIFSQWKNHIANQNPKSIPEIYDAMNLIKETITADNLNDYVKKARTNCELFLTGIRSFDK